MSTQTTLNEVKFFSQMDSLKYKLTTDAPKVLVEDYIKELDNLKEIKALLLLQGYTVISEIIHEDG